jgi:hypothetical protein
VGIVGERSLTHNFAQQLAWSETASHEQFWDAVYRKAFPNMVNHMLCSGDTKSQRMGIDRIVFLGNGMTIAIDEKKRSEVYADVLLEYISVDTTNAPGWIEKDLAIDYLAYAFMPTQKCYLFPWQLLRRVWVERGEKWKQWAERRENGFRIVKAKNQTYNTYSIAVPLKSLLKAIEVATEIDVSQECST